MIIYLRHLRAAGMCHREPRKWFEAHGLSWNDFLTNGVPASTIEAIGDPLGLRVVEIARAEELQRGR